MRKQQLMRIGTRKYGFAKSFYTTISEDYLPEWDLQKMLEQSIQNCLDEAQRAAPDRFKQFFSISISSIDGQRYYRILDKGAGVEYGDIVALGRSNKRSREFKGQFGEGESNSFLVAVREGIDKVFVSKDYALKGRMGSHPDLPNLNVLIFDLYQTNKAMQGTAIYYQASPQVEEALEYLQREVFIELRPRARRATQRGWISAESPGAIYIKGQRIGLCNAAFSYNLVNTPVNRDRFLPADEVMLSEISQLWRSQTNYALIEQFLRTTLGAEDKENSEHLLEQRVSFRFAPVSSTISRRWARAFRRVFSGRAVLVGPWDFRSNEVNAHGYRPITVSNRSLRRLLQDGGVLHGDEILKQGGWYQVHHSSLPKAARFKVKWAKKIAHEVLGLPRPPNPERYSECKGPSLSVWDAPYHHEYEMVWLPDEQRVSIRKDFVTTASLEKVIITYIHELGHFESGAEDASREFEKWWEGFALKALTDFDIAQVRRKIAYAERKLQTLEEEALHDGDRSAIP